ncbi:LUD domain-containing protein [Croceivirga thetidis]|uniref:LUD domain-containing protein n=1 Tax=Croceivirga thetidis TaxID=2721623 RepID=A0ABX1GWI4_9FLAO|nr:LUD domain-containing protein [Croceivirga thetidis]NKI33371.1 LUD domain-containing protein [Croceivirga thetidis]
MGVFGKLFGGGKKIPKETLETNGEHLPELKLPVDEKFTVNFKRNGGKFIYCENFNEILATLDNIIEENDWQNQPFSTLDTNLQQRFEKENLSFADLKQSKVFFTTCENLIAHDGSILVCSNQIKEKKLSELPLNVIVYATTSQLMESISDALKAIKTKYLKKLPDNITSLKHFQLTEENKNDFLSYGSASKNIYLLLLEDY